MVGVSLDAAPSLIMAPPVVHKEKDPVPKPTDDIDNSGSLALVHEPSTIVCREVALVKDSQPQRSRLSRSQAQSARRQREREVKDKGKAVMTQNLYSFEAPAFSPISQVAQNVHEGGTLLIREPITQCRGLTRSESQCARRRQENLAKEKGKAVVQVPTRLTRSESQCARRRREREITEKESATLIMPAQLDLELNPIDTPSLHRQPDNNTNLWESNCIEGEDEGYFPNSNSGPQMEHRVDLSLYRHCLGRMSISCTYCGALHWKDERLSSSSSRNPKFGSCCLQGKIKLPLLLELPPALQALYDGDDPRAVSFRTNIRQYNISNAFTSLGVSMDDRILNGQGLTSFTIHGELHHLSGALMPDDGVDPVFSQIYIHDPVHALEFRQNRNLNLSNDVLQIIQETLLEHNQFSKLYKHAYEVLRANVTEDNNLHAYLHYREGTDRRRYNLPTADEIAVILPGDGSEFSKARDIILHLRSGQALQRISECHPAYIPLHYVLFFPYGELGWSQDLVQFNVQTNEYGTDRLTQLQYYAYRLFQRTTEYSPILRGGRLFQEFLVDNWAAYEQNRLRYIRFRQDLIRADVYKGLTDIATEGLDPSQVGKKVILPSSHIGSPRQLYEIYQDSMAITRYHRHPDIFLTVTANPNWPEIQNELMPHQCAVHRPDLVARVFELKRSAIMKEIQDKCIFGRAVAHVFTIEFQKRGLPHMHALIFLQDSDKIRTSAQIDNIVCAEFPDESADPALFDTVKTCMVHGPCGHKNPDSPCMRNGRCSKHYPRKFVDETTMDDNAYPTYRRRNDNKFHTVRGCEADNRDIVPYNPHLSRMFNCHINAEICASIRAVKYIHKYIYKGHDRTTMVLAFDEIQRYIDARYIGPPEAAWRLFEYPMHEEKPNVVRLALHLPGCHNVVFRSNESFNDILSRAEKEETTLTGFFKCCSETPHARQFTYQDFPQHFVWSKNKRVWTERQRGIAIGRLYFASPNEGERFYLRLLLTTIKGPTSFEHLRTVNGMVCSTFKEACIARGLLEDDDEWTQCLEEASSMNTGHQLRRLFVVILLECSPAKPDLLWNRFSPFICDDLKYKIRTKFSIENPDEGQVTDYGLHLLNELLSEFGKSLLDFPPMPQPIENWNMVEDNRLIWEQRQLIYDGLQDEVEVNRRCLNSEQLSSYNVVIDSVLSNQGRIFFLNGSAGTGKTFLYNTIANSCRVLGHIVIMVASSGIASLLLYGGRTAHSTFRIPFDIHENSVCSFTKQSIQAGLFKEAKLIIWDEITMQHKYCIEAVDRSLKDIRDSQKPFGGITVVFGGDFQQILPVVNKGVREQIVGASIRKSSIWGHIQVLNLVRNMRLDMTDPNNAEFANFLLKVGKNSSDIVQLSPTIRYYRTIQELILSIYPQLNIIGATSASLLKERTILAARNDDVNAINDTALHQYPGRTFEYLSADKVHDEDSQPTSNNYPTEFLNSLNPSGFPPFKLRLKVGSPIMLLRNIAPKDGLCNGTRLIVVRCGLRVIEAKILVGDKTGNLVFIPRISLTTSTGLPFQISRRQFPVKLAYAMTINKAQGQSVKYVGIDLRIPVFSHGQLYVALSRCTSANRISLLLPNDSSTTTNIVYPEVLLS